MSTWMKTCRVGSSSLVFSQAVSLGLSFEPTTSTRSASPMQALAAAVPNVPNTPSASGWVSGKQPLPAAVVADRHARSLRELAQLLVSLGDAHAVAGDDDRARGARMRSAARAIMRRVGRRRRRRQVVAGRVEHRLAVRPTDAGQRVVA